VWSFDGLEAFVGSGLGGGSLIYANVLLRKDERWFVHDEPRADDGYEHWPVTRAELEPHYDRVEARLAPVPYPFADTTPKTQAFRAAAEKLELDWSLPGLAIAFAPSPGAEPRVGEPVDEARPNLHGRTRSTCRLCGECAMGCNYGAKNTLDFNYLSDAAHGGADIRSRCEVRSFAPREGGGYRVEYVEHDEAADGVTVDTWALPRRALTTDRLVLAAGTLGSTYLMLRNRSSFPALSPRLGTRFSGNGDFMGITRRIPRDVDPGRGPTITSAVRVPDALDGGSGRGFYMEDCGIPPFLSWLLHAAEAPAGLRRTGPLLRGMLKAQFRRPRATNLGGDLAKLLGDASFSHGLLPVLGMGRDVPDGVMCLRGGALEVRWRKAGASKELFDRMRALSRQIAEALDGRFLDTPAWHLNRVATVHPLGGCPMGRTAEEGVVDAVSGEVFGHPGLHVVDGSVMPGPVGPNPSLTIAAVADRFVDGMLRE
jgi:cholesterol oxidase